jgi:HEAT repeat protein
MGDDSWRVRKEAVEQFVGSAPDESSLDALLELLRNEENAGLRNSAAEALICLGSLAAMPLISRVKDSDPDVRKSVIDVMGAIGDPLFVPQLRDALHDSDINVASAAAEQLGCLGDPRVISDLLQALVSQESILFRFSALGALSALATPGPVPHELFKLAEQQILRKAVFDCLGSISDDGSVTLLLEGLTCRQSSCRAAALKALYKIYRRSAVSVGQKIRDTVKNLKGSPVIPPLFELFSCQDVILTEALIWLSVVTEDVRSLPLLIETSRDERHSKDALAALKHFGHEAFTEMVASYATLDENGRGALCSLIGDCGYFKYGSIVTDALGDPAADVRKAAAYSIGKLGLVSSIQRLVARIDDIDPDVSTAAALALRELSSLDRQSILDIACRFSGSTSPLHRQVAALLLATLDERERLLLLIKDEEPLVRMRAISAIGASSHTSSVPLLVMALNDEDPDVRIAAADALAETGDTGVLDSLEHALSDEDVWVQCALLRAITAISEERALTTIVGLQEKADVLLLITCLKLLEGIGGPEAEKLCKAALCSTNPDIARQAAMSLARFSDNTGK